MEYDFKFKVVVIGDPAVGKTTLMLQFTEQKFQELYIPTVGVQVSIKNVLREKFGKKLRIGLYIWDVSGQTKFSKIRKLFYEGSSALIIVFDITNKISYINSSKWYKDISKILNKDKILGFLIGNKKDLEKMRQISTNSGKILADKMELGFYETSAMTGENVNEMFEDLTNKIINNIDEYIIKEEG